MQDAELMEVAKRVEVEGKPLAAYSEIELKEIALSMLAEAGEKDLPNLDDHNRVSTTRIIVTELVKMVAHDKGKKIKGGYEIQAGGKSIDRTEIREFWNELQSI